MKHVQPPPLISISDSTFVTTGQIPVLVRVIGEEREINICRKITDRERQVGKGASDYYGKL